MELSENRRSLIESQFKNSENASSVNEKWSKNHDLMCPYRVPKNADMSIFHELHPAITS